MRTAGYNDRKSARRGSPPELVYTLLDMTSHRISQDKYAELQRYKARPLDVLITVMATVGRCCVLPEDIEPAIITKHVYRISARRNVISPHYLMHALRSSILQSQIQRQTRGQTRPGINGEMYNAPGKLDRGIS